MPEETEDMSEEEVAEAQEEEAGEKEQALREAEEAAAYGYPPPVEKPSPFQFFGKVVDAKDSSKTANLTNEELGKGRLSVRDYDSLAWFHEMLGNNKVALYLYGKSELLKKTSLSRDGFLLNLSITQRKEMKKAKSKEVSKWSKPR